MHESTLPKIVGIVNVTPDSFSDGGAYYDAEDACVQVQRLWEQGADMVDIGAESTRPGSTALVPEQERARLQPALEYVAQHAAPRLASVSIDTRHSSTARWALQRYGVGWINDVSGCADAPMQAVLAEHTACRLVLTHALSVPADPSVVLQDADVIGALQATFAERIRALERAGIARERIVLDPGIGFGKTSAQSWQILRGIERLHTLGCPLYVGHSRKSFLQACTASAPAERDGATLALSLTLAARGVHYLRVHNVPMHVQALAALAYLQAEHAE